MDVDGVPLESVGVEQVQVALRARSLTVRQLVEAYLARIEAYDRSGPCLGAVVTLAPDALARADEADAALRTGTATGLLHGIPVLVKDNIETGDLPTSFGSEVFARYQSARDATVVARLRQAGAIVLGKTALPDFATSWFARSSRSGTTRNPYALDREPGGSSTGTAAALAAFFATVGLGTDCAGSVRVPASFCGLVGLRPTPGLVSRAGCSPLVDLQDTVGPLGRSVADVARVLDVLVGPDPADPSTSARGVPPPGPTAPAELVQDPIAGTRIGVLRSVSASAEHPAGAPVDAVMTDVLARLSDAGAVLVDVELPDLQGWVLRTSLYLTSPRHDLDRFLGARPAAPMRSVTEVVGSGRHHPGLELLQALAAGPEDPTDDAGHAAAVAARAPFRQVVVALLETWDLAVLAYPSVRIEPPTRADCDAGTWTMLNFPTNTVIASHTGLPALTVPAGRTPRGLPVGLELLARPYDEATLLRVGHGVEELVDPVGLPASTPAL